MTKAQQEFEVAKLEAEKAEQVARKVRAEGEAEAAIAAAKLKKEKQEEEAAPAEPSEEVKLLTEIKDLLAAKQ